MKRLIGIMTGILLAVSISGCVFMPERAGYEGQAAENDGPVKVVTTLFPYYDFVRQIGGDKVDVRLVVPAGMDSHSFEPTPADMIAIQNTDVLICNGGSMENWLLQVLDASDTSDMRVVTMMDNVDVAEEEIVEGMETEGHIHSEEDDGHEAEIEYDEHIWTSPVNAVKIVGVTAQALAEEDPENSRYYQDHADAYIKKLEALDGEFRMVMEKEKRNLIVVGDKFPFRYLAKEYGLRYRAAFSGCSSDTEPSAQTIAYLIDKIRKEEIPVIYYLELSTHRVADIISEETGAVPLLLHSCHNVTRREFENGITYLELMEQNVENLRKGLDE